MKIFISWSGPRERAVAEALKAALPDLCAADVEIFVSSKSITKGANGIAVIEANLDASAYGIILVSKGNMTAPWLNYEGGWLASALERPVATICLDLRPSDITTALAPRQATQFEDDEDMARLLREIVSVANPAMKDRTFKTLLADVWPRISDSWGPGDAEEATEPIRQDSDMLAELIERVRRIEEVGQITQARVQETLHRTIVGGRRLPPLTEEERRTPRWNPYELAVKKVVKEVSGGSVTLVYARLSEDGPEVALAVSRSTPRSAVTAVKEAVDVLTGDDTPTRFTLSMRPGSAAERLSEEDADGS